MTGVDCFTDYYDPAHQARQPRGARSAHRRFALLEARSRRGRSVAAARASTSCSTRPRRRACARRGGGVRGLRPPQRARDPAPARALPRRAKLERFVYASSSSVYGDAERYPTDETLLPRPFSPYGVTKLAGEHLALLYGRNFGAAGRRRCATSPVYGPRQRPDMAFHKFCRGDAARRADPGLRRRQAVARLHVHRRRRRGQRAGVEAGTASGVYNVGGGSQVEVLEAIAHPRAGARREGASDSREPRPPGDPLRTRADATRCARTSGSRRRAPIAARTSQPRPHGRRAHYAGRRRVSRAAASRSWCRRTTRPRACLSSHRELVRRARRAWVRTWEIVYVDDGSRDGTDAVLARPRRRRTARCAALAAARTSASRRRSRSGSGSRAGDWVATIDADLQDDPAELPRLMQALDSGLDLVSGWKQKRQDPISKTLPSSSCSTR